MDTVDIIKGQTVILELEDECVIGEILHIGVNRSFVRLTKVRDFQSNQVIAGNQDYYNSEVKSLRIVEESESPDESFSNIGTSANSSVSTSTVARINLDDVQEIYNRIDQHTFINQTDVKYHDAMKYLKTQKLIAVAMEGVQGGRHASAPSLLSIATLDRIFVFDIMWMKVTKDMKALLTNPKTRRVVHNGRFLGDALKHRFDTPVGKCFDTLVAHISTSKDFDDQKEFSVQQCLSKYLNLPNNFFDQNISFEHRPLNEAQRKAAAKNVAFLLTLQDYFIHEIMLEPFYKSCDRYVESLAGYTEHVASIVKLSQGHNVDLHDIEQFKLNISNDSNTSETTQQENDESTYSTVQSAV